jgi:spoIIIJ-associated protein
MEHTETITKLTQELVEQLGFQADVEVKLEGSMYNVHLKTDSDASLLIGKHSRMLASLQRVLSAMLYQKIGEKIDVLLDVNDYREAQKERLIGIANNVAQRVVDEQRDARLSSFSAYERRIIHEHIAENYTSLESYSEGEGLDRSLIIAIKKS